MKNKQKQIMKPYSQLNTTLIDEIGEKINFFLKNKSIPNQPATLVMRQRQSNKKQVQC